MREIVLAPDFLDGNYLSTELRVPVTLLQTNACSPLATNAIAGNIWDNFSSQTYKDLPSVGTITVHDPFTGEPSEYRDAGRRPRLHAAAVADQPVVDRALPAQQHGRARSTPARRSRRGWRSFQDGIEQMLWPEKRAKDPVLGDKVPGLIDRTTAPSYVTIPAGFQPDLLVTLLEPFRDVLPRLVNDDGDIEIGPIPERHAGRADRQPQSAPDQMGLLRPGQARRQAARSSSGQGDPRPAGMPRDASDEEARKAFANLVDPHARAQQVPGLRGQSRPLFRHRPVRRGAGLSDAEKRDLIEFLKTF